MHTGMLGVTIYLSSSLAAAITAGVVAPAKRRHPGYWITISFLFPPFVLILLWLPKGQGYPYWGEPFDDSLD
jgi:hypothetical protein